MSEFPGIFGGVETELGVMMYPIATGEIEPRSKHIRNSVDDLGALVLGQRDFSGPFGGGKNIMIAQMFPHVPELSGWNSFTIDGSRIYSDCGHPEISPEEGYTLKQISAAYYRSLRTAAEGTGPRDFYDPEHPEVTYRFNVGLDTNVVDAPNSESWAVHYNLTVAGHKHPSMLNMQKYYAIPQVVSFANGGGHVIPDSENGYRIVRSQRIPFVSETVLADSQTNNRQRALVNTRSVPLLSHHDQRNTDESKSLNRAHIINQVGRRIERSFLAAFGVQIAVIAAAHSDDGIALLNRFTLRNPLEAAHAVGKDDPTHDTIVELENGKKMTISHYIEDLADALSQRDDTGDPDVQKILAMYAADMSDYREDWSSLFGRYDDITKKQLVDWSNSRLKTDDLEKRYNNALLRAHHWNDLRPENDLSEKVRKIVDAETWSPLGPSNYDDQPTGRPAVRGEFIHDNLDEVTRGSIGMYWDRYFFRTFFKNGQHVTDFKRPGGSFTADIHNGGISAEIIEDE